MQIPQLISQLHFSVDQSQLSLQLTQGQEYRAQAFLLPSPMQHHAAFALSMLSDKCSLFIEQLQPDLALRHHDGHCHINQQLVTQNGHTLAIAKQLGDGGLVPYCAFKDMAIWLVENHRYFICPAAVQPVAQAILNIWPLDPYLAKHFLNSFVPLLANAEEKDFLAVFQARREPLANTNEWAQAYIKLEKKLHRSYLGH